MHPLGPQVRGYRSLLEPSPGPPAPPPRALPPASPARPGRCFYPAEPSPTRVAACSRELIPAGRGRRLPARAARLSKGHPPIPPAPAPRSRPAHPPCRTRALPAFRLQLPGTPGRAPRPGRPRSPTPSDRPVPLSLVGPAGPALADAARPLPPRVSRSPVRSPTPRFHSSTRAREVRTPEPLALGSARGKLGGRGGVWIGPEVLAPCRSR